MKSLAWLALVLVAAGCARTPRTGLAFTGVRVDNAFRLPGSDSSGLIVSVRIDQLKPGMNAHDFGLSIFDDTGHGLGVDYCLGMRWLGGTDQRWILLGDPISTLEQSYRSLIEAKTAVVEHNRRKPIERPGLYEFMYLIGRRESRAELLYGDYRPDPQHPPIASFKIPRREPTGR